MGSKRLRTVLNSSESDNENFADVVKNLNEAVANVIKSRHKPSTSNDPDPDTETIVVEDVVDASNKVQNTDEVLDVDLDLDFDFDDPYERMPDFVVTSPNHYSEDKLDPIVNVKVSYQSKVKLFPLRKYENLKSIEDYYKNITNVPKSRLLFLVGNEELDMNCSSADFDVCNQVIECCVLPETYETERKPKIGPPTQDYLQFYIQWDAVRTNKVCVWHFPHEEMDALIGRTAHAIKKTVGSFFLRFDGVTILPNQTVQSLELEGEECFDVYDVPDFLAPAGEKG